MLRKMVLMVFVMLFSVACVEGADPIGLDITASVATENNWYGYDLNDGQGIWGLGATYQIPELPIIGKGLSVGVDTIFPISSGFEEQTRADYSIAYGFSLLKETPAQLNTSVSYTYLDFVKGNRGEDLHQIAAKVSLPNVLKVLGNPLVPRVTAVRFWDVSNHNGPTKDIMGNPLMESSRPDMDGWIFIVGANYYMPIMKQTVNLFSDITYNDGIGATDSDLSHITLGASTDFAITDSVKLTPFVKYQISQEDTVSNDSVYGGAAITISF